MGRRTEDAADALQSVYAYEKEFAKLELPTKGRLALIYVGLQPEGEASLMDVRKACGMSTSFAKYICDALIEAELIVRFRPHKGRRTSLLKLTPHGRSVIDGLIARLERATRANQA